MPASCVFGSYSAGVSRGIALAACVFAVAAGTAAGATRSAVLRGTVLAAPEAPICMPRVPCMHPAAGVVLAFTRGGVIRARVTTGADGTYRVSLVPARYGVRVLRPTGVQRINPASVRVEAGQVRRLSFYLDTGIR